MWKLDPKDKHVHQNIYIYIHTHFFTYIYETCCNGVTKGTRGREEKRMTVNNIEIHLCMKMA
jgi:hypothetical protein